MKAAAIIFIIVIMLVPLSLFAEPYPEIEVEKVFLEKKAFVKDFMQLTDKESAVFGRCIMITKSC
jgi:hypothetical protein